jgi:hypothetical protein
MPNLPPAYTPPNTNTHQTKPFSYSHCFWSYLLCQLSVNSLILWNDTVFKCIFSVLCSRHYSSEDQTHELPLTFGHILWNWHSPLDSHFAMTMETGYPKWQWHDIIATWFTHPEIRSRLAMTCNTSLKSSILISYLLKATVIQRYCIIVYSMYMCNKEPANIKFWK